MKNILFRILIIAPFVFFSFLVINKELPNILEWRSKDPEVLGSSIIFTVGESGISCTTAVFTTNPVTGQPVEIDGISFKGAPLGSDVTFTTNCVNTGQISLQNTKLTNNLSGQNQGYLTFKEVSDLGCHFDTVTVTCDVGTVTPGSNFTRSITTIAVMEVPATAQIINTTNIIADDGVSATTVNQFNIFQRPTCNSLGPSVDPIRIPDNTSVAFTASGTTYDGTAPTYIYNFNDGSNDQTVTTSNSSLSHLFRKQSGETESSYFTFLRIVDSVGNATGDAANCSANCSKIIKVGNPPGALYCSCNNGIPACSLAENGVTCSSAADCNCGIYCDQGTVTVTPVLGKSPLAVSIHAEARGQITPPTVFKLYEGSNLLKQVTSTSNTIDETLTLINSTQTIQTHNLSITVTDSSGKSSQINCAAVVTVQPGNGHYECQGSKCIYSNNPGSSSCTNDSTCTTSNPISCILNPNPASGVAPLPVNLTTTCQGGNPPYVKYDFIFGVNEGNLSSSSSVANHTYQTKGDQKPNVVVTDSIGNKGNAETLVKVGISAPQPIDTKTHLECASTTQTCEAVIGAGNNLCQTNSDCDTGSTIPKHLACNRTTKSCSSYFGFGNNACSSNTDCLNAGTTSETHLECNVTTKICEAIDSVGVNVCQASSGCTETPRIPRHFVCNKIRKTCDSYFGFGNNTCKSTADCQNLENGYVIPTILISIIGTSLLTLGVVFIIRKSKINAP